MAMFCSLVRVLEVCSSQVPVLTVYFEVLSLVTGLGAAQLKVYLDLLMTGFFVQTSFVSLSHFT